MHPLQEGMWNEIGCLHHKDYHMAFYLFIDTYQAVHLLLENLAVTLEPAE